MKKLLIVFLSLSFCVSTFGQSPQCTALPSLTPSSCTPLSLPGPGFSDTAICIVQGEVTNTTVSFQNFSTISGITVEWIRIDSLTNLPCGLTFAMNDPDNTLITAENGCIAFTGITSADAGTYALGIWVTVKVNILPGPISAEASALSAQFGGPPFGFFIIVNNPGVPCSGVSQVTVSGNIVSETSSAIKTVTVNSTGPSASTDLTDTLGEYSLIFNPGDSTTITPSKSDDVSTNNGNTTLDILLVRRHLLAIQPLNSPYKIIAGDVDGNNGVSTADILRIRQVILAITSSFPNDRLWTFVPDDYQFADPQQPWGFPTNRTYSNLSADQTEQDFIGIKLGDVNNDWNPFVAKASTVGEVQFEMNEQNVLPSQEITVPVKAKDFKNVTGYQFTLSWNPEVLELTKVGNKSINGYYGEQKIKEGFLTTSWDDELAKGISLNDNEIVFDLKFKVVGATGSHSEIKIGSELTESEAYNENLDLLNIVPTNGMVKVGDNSSIVNHQSTIYNLQVQPNPFSNATQITFEIPKDEIVSLVIYDLLGKEVKRLNSAYKAGEHKIEWAGDDDSGKSLSNGLYHVRMTAGVHSLSTKAVMLK